jgi:fluoride exporter
MDDERTTKRHGEDRVAYLVAALGGALGALARWGVSLALPGTPGGLPWATLAVNLAGCLLIGVLLAVLPARFPQSIWLRPFLAVGVLGGFTTFSTFAVDVVRLGEAGASPVALAYVAASVLGGVACVLLGLTAARALLHPTGSLLAELQSGEDQT